jgi:hypothetical protein
MASTQLFSGQWIITVSSKDANASQRYVIQGSDASDGIYAGETTTPPVSVSGPRWFLRFEWNDNAGSGWQPSDVRRVAASYTLQEGLTTLVGADDNFEQFRDHDFNDLVLRCRNLDPELNPRIPLFNMPDFTLPADVRDTCADGYDGEAHYPDKQDQGNRRNYDHYDGRD